MGKGKQKKHRNKNRNSNTETASKTSNVSNETIEDESSHIDADEEDMQLDVTTTTSCELSETSGLEEDVNTPTADTTREKRTRYYERHAEMRNESSPWRKTKRDDSWKYDKISNKGSSYAKTRNSWDSFNRRERKVDRDHDDEFVESYKYPRKSESSMSYMSSSRKESEYETFQKLYNTRELEGLEEYTEEFGDLFDVSKDHALAHCVAEDMNMGSGIAVRFRREFKRVDELLQQRVKQGGCAYLEQDGRYIYYLVTKRNSYGKPTNETLYRALTKMRSLIEKHNVKKLAMPLIGCGLDGLNWVIVKKMIAYIFRNISIEIRIYQLIDPANLESPEQKPSLRKAKVIHQSYPLSQIEAYTIILYFGYESGEITNLMNIKELDDKFGILKHYNGAKIREIGVPIKSTWGNYLFYGCITNRTAKEPFDFENFQSCLNKIRKDKETDEYYYIAIEEPKDASDLLLSTKLINLIRYTFHSKDIYVCGSTQREERGDYGGKFK